MRGAWGALAYATLDASSAGWGSAKVVSLLALSVALIGGFVGIEQLTDWELGFDRHLRAVCRTTAAEAGADQAL